MQTVAIIRPRMQLEASRELVEAYGYSAIATSLIEVVEVKDPRWHTFTNELHSCTVDYVVITSANGVYHAVSCGLVASDIPKQTRVIAIGPHTQQALLKAGFRVDAVPHEFSSEGLVKLLNDVAGRNVWLLRSAYGSVSLGDKLLNRGAVVNEVTLYTLKQLCGAPQQAVIGETIEGDVAAVLFTSTMTVRSFFSCASRRYDNEKIVRALSTRVVGAIGRPTETALKRFGVHTAVVPTHATFSDLVAHVDTTLRERSQV